jgi:hypothetical protein
MRRVTAAIDGDKGTRIVKGRVLGVAEIGVHPSLVGPRHGEAVPEHDQIELGALERHRHVLPQLRPCPLVAGRPGPRPSVEAEPACGLNAQNHIRCILVIAAHLTCSARYHPEISWENL